MRAGGVGTSLDGVEVRSVAAGSCLCSVGHPLGARASRPHPIPANSLPSTATPLQGAPNPPLRGSLPSCRSLCGRDARAPGWSLCGRDARAPGGSFFTSRSVSTVRMVRETNRPTRWRWNPCALEELARHWMASKSEVLRRAPVCVRWGIPWERGRPARTLFLQTACHPRPLPCKAHQTRLCGVLCHRAGLCAGGTPALPGGLCAGGTPALPGGVYSFPPPDPWRTPLESPPTPSWPFVDNLFAFSWILYVSWLFSSSTISRATSRARSGWPGGREMAATTGWPPPP